MELSGGRRTQQFELPEGDEIKEKANGHQRSPEFC